MKFVTRDLYSSGEWIDNRYQIEDIKRGNLGVVYLCIDHEKQEPIAIKTFDSRFFQSEKRLQNFIQEALTWIELERHPNIVEAKSIQIIEDQLYLFLERVIADNPRGSTLKDLFFTQTLDLRRMIQLAIHICDGMIHALNKFPTLVHRDLKSENILIGREGLPKICDFGMTLHRDLDDFSVFEYSYDLDLPFSLHDLARRMEGTPAYASPEQCQSQPIDTRSDIYSMGCILYHMATKHLPFHRPTVEETILAQIREKPTSPVERSDRIDPRFSDIILTCLQKSPKARYQSFDTLRYELLELYNNQYNEYPVSFQYGSPLTAEEYRDRAQSFALLHQYGHARAELMKALHLASDHSEFYFLLGKYSFLEGEYDRAILELKESLIGMPHEAEIHEWLGKAYLRRAYNEEAIVHFRETIRLNPELPTAYHELTALLLRRGESARAEQILMDALVFCSDKIPFYLRLANLYNRNGDVNGEYQILEQSLSVDPEHPEVLLRLAEISQQINRSYYMREWTKKAAHSRLKTFYDWYRLGKLYLAQNNSQRAMVAWKNAAATGEGSGEFYVQIAKLLKSQRKDEEAWPFVLRAEEKGEDVSALKFDIQARRFRRR